MNRAVTRFVSNSKTGEFGEIILFHLLERYQGAVQIVNKMSLKTSGNMYVNGSDAIHFSMQDGLKVLYLGESKTGIQFSSILKNALSDISKYEQTGAGSYDVSLASNNISGDIPEERRKLIKDYLDPNKSDLSDFSKIHAVFLGVQRDTLRELEKDYRGPELFQKAIENYKEGIEQYIKIIQDELKNHPDIENTRFLFFIIPFKDLTGLRANFSQAIEHGKKATII